MICAVADVHLGNHRMHGGPVVSGMNTRCNQVLSVLRSAAAQAKQQKAPLFVLGDLFDTSRPEPQLIAATQTALSGIDAYVLLGNHDMVSTADGDHALGPLDGYGLITVVDKPMVVDCGRLQVMCAPFRPGDARDWLPGVVAELSKMCDEGPTRVLLFHLGIIDSETAPWLKAAHDAVPVELVESLMEEHGITSAMAGNWHERRYWPEEGERRVMQVGTLSPTGWDNPGLTGYGTLASCDDAGKLTYTVLPGPRFLKLKAGAALPRADGCQLYVRMTAEPEQLDEARQAGAALVDQGALAGFEAALDDKEVQAQTRAAAGAARAAETMDQALDNYVREMQLDDGVDRASVLARCRGFLK